MSDTTRPDATRADAAEAALAEARAQLLIQDGLLAEAAQHVERLIAERERLEAVLSAVRDKIFSAFEF